MCDQHGNCGMCDQHGNCGSDIIPPPYDDDDDEKRATAESVRTWPDMVVPYSISSKFTKIQKKKIEAAIKKLNSYMKCKGAGWQTKSKRDKYYVLIYKGSGCSSTIGYWGKNRKGKQTLSLSANCLVNGIIQHEMMHTMGFKHEQVRGDRDEYVRIHYENIDSKYRNNFKRIGDPVAEREKSSSYDFGSVMHYRSTSFSNNGKSTITAVQGNEETRRANEDKMGQRKGLSEKDKDELNTLYKCIKE